jgi:hypothetical protein
MKMTFLPHIFPLAVAGLALGVFTAISARAEDDLVATAKAFVQQAAAHADQ